MKCPYCGIHYADDETECPICGKRPSALAPKKKSKFTKIPYEPAQNDSNFSDRRASSSETSQRRKKAPPSGKPPQRQKSSASGCLIVVIAIVVILFLCFALFGLRSYSNVESFTTDDAVFFADDDDIYVTEEEDLGGEETETDVIYERCDIADVLSGSWEISDGDLSFTVNEDGSVDWSTGDGSAADPNPTCFRVNLDEENASDYVSDDDLSRYPADAYTRYELDLYDDQGTLGIVTLYLYYPTGAPLEAITALDCYVYHTGTYCTLVQTESANWNIQST